MKNTEKHPFTRRGSLLYHSFDIRASFTLGLPTSIRRTAGQTFHEMSAWQLRSTVGASAQKKHFDIGLGGNSLGC